MNTVLWEGPIAVLDQGVASSKDTSGKLSLAGIPSKQSGWIILITFLEPL